MSLPELADPNCQQRAAWHHHKAPPRRAFVYPPEEGSSCQSSATDQAKLQTGNFYLAPCVTVFKFLPGHFFLIPLSLHYSEGHASQVDQKKSESAELWSFGRGEHPSRAQFEDLQTSLTATALFHAPQLPWQRPAKWAWEHESHGHSKSKQVSFMTATWPHA